MRYLMLIYRQTQPHFLTEKCDADIVLIGQSKIAEFDDVELEINYPTTFSFLRQTVGDVTVAYPYKKLFCRHGGILN